jgi:AcrR family transcriptional regulator
VTKEPTLLERQLAGNGERAVAPVDALKAARRTFLKRQRVDMQELAAELGVGRATLYRWVGSRDQLIAEILWSSAQPTLRELRAHPEPDPVEWVMHVYKGYGDVIAEFTPLHHFVENEPEAALRILTSKSSPLPRRTAGFYREVLEEAIATRGLQLRLDPETLSFVLVRIAESFLWADLLTGEQVDMSKVHEVARVLLSST